MLTVSEGNTHECYNHAVFSKIVLKTGMKMNYPA